MALGWRAWGIAASVSGAMLQFHAEHQPGGHVAFEVGECVMAVRFFDVTTKSSEPQPIGGID
jgi:hypothetical protein